MKAVLKWVGIAVVCLAAMVIAALLIIPHFIDARHYRAPFEKMVAEATGRSFSVGGDVRLSLFPWAGVSFSELRLGNPPGFPEPDFLAVRAFEVRLKLLPLLFGEVRVERLVISGPRVFLITHKDGRVSWDFDARSPKGPKPAAPATGSAPAAPSGLPITSLEVGELSVSDGTLTLIDHNAASRQELSKLRLELKDLSLDRPVHFSASGDLNGKPVAAHGRLGPAGANLGQGRVPLELDIEAAGHLKVRATGGLENLLAGPRSDLTIAVAEFSPRRLLADFGLSVPDTADPKVIARLSLAAAVKADAASVTVADGRLNLDQSQLTFNLTATEFAKPNVAFTLALDQIDLDRYLPPAAGRQAAGGEAPPRPAEVKTDYGALRKLVMDGTVTVGRLTAAKATVEKVNLKVRARDGVISLDPFGLTLYQGSAAGKTVVNVGGERPVTELHVTLDKVQANPLIRDLAGKDIIEGLANARISLSMVGDDPARIKQSLNGNGRIDFADGAIVGVDLAGMVRNVRSAFTGQTVTGPRPRTDFSELAVPFTLQRGVFATTEALMRSPLLRLLAAGKADLVRETLDFRLEPRIVGTIKGQGDEKERAGLVIPVIVSGSFADPVFRPDLAGMAKEGLKGIVPTPGAPTDAPTLQEKAGGLLKGILPGKK